MAKIAVALLYAATVVVVLKEFVGHGHRPPDKHAEREPAAINSWLAAGAKNLALRAQRYRSALNRRHYESPMPLAAAILLAAFLDHASHEHPVDHKSLMPKRRGRRFGWKEPLILSLLLAVLRFRPPANAQAAHRFRLRRLAENTIIV